MEPEILRVDREQQENGTGRRRHPNKVVALPRRKVGAVERHIEARKPQRRAHREYEHGDPAETVQVLKRPVEHDDRWRHAEIHEVGEAVELGAEARRNLEQTGDAPIDAVEEGREYERCHREIPTRLDAHADGGEAGAESDEREDVRDEDPDRHLAAGEDELPAFPFVAFWIEGWKHTPTSP